MMSEGLVTLTAAEWQIIEKLNDVFAQKANLQTALQEALQILLSAFTRTAGALYLPHFCDHLQQDWIFHNPPEKWLAALEDKVSPLWGQINQTLATGQVQPGLEALDLAAVIPLQFADKTSGALLTCGEKVAVQDYSRWQVMLRPITRAVLLYTRLSLEMNNAPSYLELLRSRNTLRAMFDSLPISIYILDYTYSLVAANYSRSDRAREKPNHLVGHKCYEALFQRSEPCPACRVGETFATGQNTVRLNRNWLGGDNFIEWDISTFPIMDEKDQVIQTIVIEQDVTEKRNLESNLIQSEKLAAVGQLAAEIAHEINNPLTAIIANSQILRRDIPADNEDLLDSVKLIEMAGTRASQVVRNLLGIARKEKYEFEPINLNETLKNALSLVHHELVGRPIQMQLNLGENLPRIIASQDQLQGVWINLILNAIDAIDKEAGLVTITSRFTRQAFEVSVMDNGKGIPSDQLPRVFEPFFTTKSAGRGTGLGLSVCKRVINHHGGNIDVESQPGKWTRFTVRLPVPQIPG